MRLLPIFAMLLLFAGCNKDTTRVGPTAQTVTHQATADLAVVAEFIGQARPWLEHIMKAYTASIENAVPLAPDVAEANPEGITGDLTPEVLAAADADANVAEKVANQVTDNQSEKDAAVGAEQEEQSKGFLSKVFSWQGVVTGLSVIGGALKLASMFGVPWARAAESAVVSLVSSGVLKDKTEPLEKGMREAETRARQLGTLVESSEVARWGLKQLTEMLDADQVAKVNENIKKLTNGQATDLNTFFKFLAQAHAVDAGQHSEVTGALSSIRDAMATEGGVPAILGKLLKA